MTEPNDVTPDVRPPLPHDPPPPPGYVDPLDVESPLSDLSRSIDQAQPNETETDT